MNNITFFALKTFMVLSLILAAAGCGNNEPPGGSNQSPTCSITSPQNNSQFNTDESILVAVVAQDTDGTIAEVQLYIDNVGHSNKVTFPYNFTINAGELQSGTHTLKAVTKDDKGALAESTISITINQSNESPDFVSFSGGQIPNTWQATAWYVDNTIGYDDIYSLRTTRTNTAVVTSKTCASSNNFVEFYLKGSGTVDFYIDDTKRKVCTLTNNWVKYCCYLENGLNTFKWEFSEGVEANLDAIHFKTETQLAVGMYY